MGVNTSIRVTLVVAALMIATPGGSALLAGDGGASDPTEPADHPPTALDGTLVRHEADGSTTLFGTIQDRPGEISRVELPQVRAVTDGVLLGGLFANVWTEQGRTIVTLGMWYHHQAHGIVNVNQYAIEAADDLADHLVDTLQRDAVPIAVNVLPHVLNWAHPTSLVLILGFALGGAVLNEIVAGALAMADQDGLAATVAGLVLHVATAPIYGANVLYPYHIDGEEGEVYRDFPTVYLWNAIQRAVGTSVYEGTYLARTGSYEESLEQGVDGRSHAVAEANKRVVVGPAVRVDGEIEHFPGVYVRHDAHRDYGIAPGDERFEATNTVTAGVWSEQTGESPGASVRFHETKQGPQAVLYVQEQRDTIMVGVHEPDGSYTPLMGTRTEATHRPHTDVDNQGIERQALESYRLTSLGLFTADEGDYVPVFGADYWGERAPTDLWALTFALTGLGDQASGDVQTRIGTFNHGGEFIAVAGARYDDDFEGHRHVHRGMVSAGLFVTDPTDPADPGEGEPGEAPDGATYVPLVATTYDGTEPTTLWTLAHTFNAPEDRGPWLVSTGVLAGSLDAYHPLVGVEFIPEGFHGGTAAGETYRIGVFPGDYETFIPVIGATYDGNQTSLHWAGSAVNGHLGASIPVEGLPFSPREDRARTTQGIYGPDGGYVPITSVDYAPTGTQTHPYGHTVRLGVFDVDGEVVPLVQVKLAFTGPVSSWGTELDPCRGAVEMTVIPTGHGFGATPPCAQP